MDICNCMEDCETIKGGHWIRCYHFAFFQNFIAILIWLKRWDELWKKCVAKVSSSGKMCNVLSGTLMNFAWFTHFCWPGSGTTPIQNVYNKPSHNQWTHRWLRKVNGMTTMLTCLVCRRVPDSLCISHCRLIDI